MTEDEEFTLPPDATAEEIEDIMANSLDEFCNIMLQQGVDEESILTTLLSVFVERACEAGDREYFDNILTAALEDEWTEHTVH